MKSFCIVALALVVCAAAETYDTKNDNVDIEGVVNDKKQLQAYVDCFTSKEDCDPVTAAFKKDMAEAIQQACAKCTPAQKHLFVVFIKGLKEKLPAEFEVYKKTYDPEDKYFSDLEAAVANA